MKPLKPIILLGLAAAIIFAIYSVFFPPAEKIIKKRLEKLAAAISARPTGNIARVANVNKIGSFFDPNVRITVEGFGREFSSLNGRGELEQAALAARQNMSSVKVQFYNLAVQVGESRTNATVQMTALVNLNDQADPTVQDVTVELVKEGRSWLVLSAKPAASRRSLEF